LKVFPFLYKIGLSAFIAEGILVPKIAFIEGFGWLRKIISET